MKIYQNFQANPVDVAGFEKTGWCGICFSKIVLKEVKNHGCIKKHCIAPRYHYLLEPNDAGDPHFYPIRFPHYVRTIFRDDTAVQVITHLPDDAKAIYAKRYAALLKDNAQQSASTKTPASNQNSLPMNRQLAALKRAEVTRKSPAQPPTKKPNILSKKQMQDSESRVEVARKTPAPNKPNIMSNKEMQDSESLDDDLEDDGLNEDQDDNEENDVNPNLTEFIISEIKLRSSIWDCGSQHVDRTKQREIDWQSIAKNVQGN